MGIKFLCPNGHKLHVKSFLAGKRAICPQCGERVIVPAEDTSNTSDVGTVSVEIPVLPELSAAAAAGPDLLTHGSSALPPSQAPASASTSSQAPSITTNSNPASSSAAPTKDPISESPSAVWYVRPATGGQFGPASGDIMRNWVRDGRVGASSLVWRAGWEDWRSAADIFPELHGLLPAPTDPAMAARSGPMPSLPQGLPVQHVAPSAPPPAAESSSSPLPNAIRKRRRRNEVSLMTSGVLLAIAVILVIVLLLVFRSQMAPTEPLPETSPATTAPAESAEAK